MAVPLTIRRLLTIQPIELQVFHPIALKLQQVLERNDFQMAEVIELANEDQSLAGQILKMANSTVNIGRVRTETIKDAVIRLGAHQVANIAMAASQAGLHTSASPIINNFMQKLWLHSHACAMGCSWIAKQTRNGGIAEIAYMAGLLHDVGKLYLLKALERLSKAGVAQAALEEALLLEIFGELHVEQGERLMQHWSLPPLYKETVEYHHCEKYDTEKPLIAIVRLVNSACKYRGIGLVEDRSVDLLELPEAEILDIYDDQIRGLFEVLDSSRDVHF